MKHNIFVWTASRMAAVSYTSLYFSFEKGAREETHNLTCARVTDSAIQTQILAGIKDTFKEPIYSKWQEVWKYTATRGSLIFRNWRCEIHGKKKNAVFEEDIAFKIFLTAYITFIKMFKGSGSFFS